MPLDIIFGNQMKKIIKNSSKIKFKYLENKNNLENYNREL